MAPILKWKQIMPAAAAIIAAPTKPPKIHGRYPTKDFNKIFRSIAITALTINNVRKKA